jgi:hypothetical protein
MEKEGKPEEKNTLVVSNTINMAVYFYADDEKTSESQNNNYGRRRS